LSSDATEQSKSAISKSGEGDKNDSQHVNLEAEFPFGDVIMRIHYIHTHLSSQHRPGNRQK
jgi:hypothetical protein